MGTKIVDAEYVELVLQKAHCIGFTHSKVKDDYIISLSFVYDKRESAATAWHYILNRLSKENCYITLIVNSENKLEITLDFRELNVKINTIHHIFPLLNITDKIDNAEMPDDSLIAVTSKYFTGMDNSQEAKTELYFIYEKLRS